jgi:biopolymer transport protein ExbD
MSSMLEEKRKAKKEFKKAVRNAEFSKKAELNVTSLMDIFVNVLIYLLMNYSTSPVDITQSKERELPKSITRLDVKHSTTIGITTRSILVNRKKVCDVLKNTVDPSLKKDKQASSYMIMPLFNRLKEEVQKQKTIEKYNPNAAFKGEITIVADRNMSFRLLSEIMYTAGQAEYSKFKFAVVKKGG